MTFSNLTDKVGKPQIGLSYDLCFRPEHLGMRRNPIADYPGITGVNWTFSFPKIKCQSLSFVRLFATPRTVAHQPPLSMEFSRQEYWSGQLFPSSGDLPYPGIEPRSPALQAVFNCLSYQGSPNLRQYDELTF